MRYNNLNDNQFYCEIKIRWQKDDFNVLGKKLLFLCSYWILKFWELWIKALAICIQHQNMSYLLLKWSKRWLRESCGTEVKKITTMLRLISLRMIVGSKRTKIIVNRTICGKHAPVVRQNLDIINTKGRIGGVSWVVILCCVAFESEISGNK